ncbi:hypothetical protein E1B28_011926 [Marasmius oreades]|uniref:ABM domain-containing protein n=1 Tax=Marasmius oreades TaxID=181124 RepID=A0A9P7RR49_9AGAR|nr:uncharacterized protein E1B28_011926 [Marasmius oreades]KAG7087878.1 hypothetical protein E1B28_011926 [Marasmius oreades]
MKFFSLTALTLLFGGAAVLASPTPGPDPAVHVARELPEGYEGKFIVDILMNPTPGRVADLHRLLLECAKVARDPTKEPGTLTYRLTRGFGNQTDIFWLYEEYESPAALKFHQGSKEFKKLFDSGALGPRIETYLTEFEYL